MRISELETPVPVIDLDRVEASVRGIAEEMAETQDHARQVTEGIGDLAEATRQGKADMHDLAAQALHKADLLLVGGAHIRTHKGR